MKNVLLTAESDNLSKYSPISKNQPKDLTFTASLPGFVFGLILPFFLLLSGPVAQAQLNLTLGQEVENDTRYQVPRMIGTIGENLYVYRGNMKILGKDWSSLERYNASMMQNGTAEVNQEYEGKYLEMIDFLVMDEQPVMFTNFVNKSLKKNFLFYQDFDPKNLKPKSAPSVMMEIPILSRSKSGEFHILPSPNRMLFLILAEIPGEKNEEEKLKVKVITASKSTMWENDIRLPVTNRLFEQKKWLVDNSGKVYLVGKLYFDKVKQAVQGEANFEYVIYAWESGKATPKEYHMSFPDKFITDFTFGIDPKGNMVGAGLWSEKSIYSVKGCFFVAIDSESGAIQAKSNSEFEPDFLSLFLNNNQAKKGKELYQYELRDILFFEDGSASLLAEQYYVVTSVTYSPGPNNTQRATTTYYYYYNDIFCLHFSPAGEVEWKTRIPKFQVTTNDLGRYSSFAAGQNGKELVLVYNDHPDNLNVKEKERLKNYMGKESCTVAVIIQPDGKWDKEILFAKKAEDVYCMPKVMQQFSPEEDFFIYGQKGRTFRMGKINF